MSAVDALRHSLDLEPAESGWLRRIASESGVAARRLQRDFEKSVGMTVHDYRTQRRVERAMALLTHGDAKTQAIANEVGWAGRKDLNRALRRATGRTPSQIRRTARDRT